MGREEGPVKVGITSSPASRLATIQTGCHFKIDILYLKQCRDRGHALWHEENFHAVHAEKRLSGEWFDMEADFALESVDTAFDLELWREEEASREYVAACLNIWPWAGDDGSHTNH
jgi:hypothetical protein